MGSARRQDVQRDAEVLAGVRRRRRSCGPPAPLPHPTGLGTVLPASGPLREAPPPLGLHAPLGYEPLRHQAISARPATVRQDLALLAHRGIAAWLQAYAELPVTAAPAPVDWPLPLALPAAAGPQAVDILLAMAKPHLAMGSP